MQIPELQEIVIQEAWVRTQESVGPNLSLVILT